MRRTLVAVLMLVVVGGALVPVGGHAGTFPGTNGKLLVGCDEGICLVWPDGTGKEVLFEVAGETTNYALSPEGLRVAYQVGYDDGTNAAIYVGSIATAQSTKVADGHQPSWSPDGSSIVFWSYEPDPEDPEMSVHNIYKFDADYNELSRLTDTGFDISPVWGPDGRIAFSSVRDPHYVSCGGFDSNNHEIYVMNGDGSGERNVTNTAGANEQVVSWFPTADELLYLNLGSPCGSGAGGSLSRISLADGGRSAVASGCNYHGAVSPDHTRIAFGSCDAGGSLYVADLPQSGATVSSPQEVGDYGLFEWTLCAEGRCDLGEPADRQVGLTLRKHLKAVGSIVSNEPDCVRGQSVRIQRKVSGKWKTVDSAVTNDEGIYRQGIADKPGDYRAKLPATEDCRAAKSLPSFHRH